METLLQRCSYHECRASFDPREAGCYDEQSEKNYCSPGCRAMAALEAATFADELQARGIEYIVKREQMIPLRDFSLVSK